MGKRTGHEKRILFISYHFPPDASVGGLRIAKFTKYLKSLGWQSYVITVKDYKGGALDFALMEELTDVKVFQTVKLPWLGEMYMVAKERLSLLGNKKNTTAPSQGRIAQKGSDKGAYLTSYQRETLAGRLRRYCKSLLLFLPDVGWPWVIAASIKAVREIRREGISCIVSSGPPHSSHLVGLIARMITKARWVADFRDPWVDDIEHWAFVDRCALSDYLHRSLECQVIRYSDKVMTTTRQLKQVFENRYHQQCPEKFLYLPNGYDSRSKSPPEMKYREFTITYTGSLYSGRTPEPLFSAVSELISQGLLRKSDIRIKFVGECLFINGVDAKQVVDSFGLHQVVDILGHVPYAEALRFMQRSHLLLLIAPSHHHLCIPAKVYEYLSSGTRILALTEKGATRDVIEETNSGACFSPNDVDGISKYILNMVRTQHSDTRPIGDHAIRQYDMQTLAKGLDQALSALVQ